MEEKTNNPPKWANFLAFFMGFIFLFLSPIYQLSQGEDAGDAFWDHALRSLDWTFMLRNFPPIIFFLGAALLVSGVILKNSYSNEKWWGWFRVAASFFLGLAFSMAVIHQLMDVAYFRGAFILLPAVYSILMMFLIILLCGKPLPILQRADGKIEFIKSSEKVLQLIAIVVCVWLFVPAAPAILGVAAAPPDPPQEGYGSAPSPYSVSTNSFAYPMPDNVSSIIGNIEGDIDFSVYVTLPNLPENDRPERIPLAIILHGFGNPYWETYVDWGTQLSAKGMAVAFVQYPSDVHPEGGDTFSLIEAQGMSNHPQHFPRSAAIASAISHLDNIALSENRNDWINETLGNTMIDPSNLWIGGHSLGAGLSFRTIDESLERGWGSESLFIALEAPYAHSVDSQLRGDMSPLPNHTMGHIAISEDDTSVSPCYGVWHQNRINSRDGTGNLDSGQVIVLKINSDRRGFPPLIASHYMQTSQVHDIIADWSFYRRADAQADYMVAMTSGDNETADNARTYLMDSSSLSYMGEWSNGVAVNEMEIYGDAMHTGPQEYQDCSSEVEEWN